MTESYRKKDARGTTDVSSTAEAFRRLTSLEHEHAEVREHLASFGAQVKHVEGMLAQTIRALEDIEKTLQIRSTTDWKTLAAWAGVIMSVVLLYTNLSLSPLAQGIAEVKTDMVNIDIHVRLADQNRIDDLNKRLTEAELRGRYEEKVDQLERKSNEHN